MNTHSSHQPSDAAQRRAGLKRLVHLGLCVGPYHRSISIPHEDASDRPAQRRRPGVAPVIAERPVDKMKDGVVDVLKPVHFAALVVGGVRVCQQEMPRRQAAGMAAGGMRDAALARAVVRPRFRATCGSTEDEQVLPFLHVNPAKP